MSEVKLCRDCKHSKPEPRTEWNLLCMHPQVNSRDPWALSGVNPSGSSAREERSRNWSFAGRRPCGMRGALFSRKDDSA